MSYKDFSDEELIERLRSGENDIADYIMEKYTKENECYVFDWRRDRRFDSRGDDRTV